MERLSRLINQAHEVVSQVGKAGLPPLIMSEGKNGGGKPTFLTLSFSQLIGTSNLRDIRGGRIKTAHWKGLC
jgi:hypothetical protein